MTKGMHVIMELYGCPSEAIATVSSVKELVDTIIKESGVNRISEFYHQFRPHGVTGIVLLAESHISVHTWPEKGYVALDIYTCGSATKALKAAEVAVEVFRPKKVVRKDMMRGLEHETEVGKAVEVQKPVLISSVDGARMEEGI